MKTFLAVSLLCLQVFQHADAVEYTFKPTKIKAPFVEQFDDTWDTRWKASGAVKQMPDGFTPSENDNVEELFRSRGEWSVEAAKKNGVAGDKGLVVKTPAAHHAISVSFPKVVDPSGKDLVVQYDLKLQDDLQCGGAYIKLLTESKSGIKYQEFDDKTPYTIMFGPDKCGATNKIHFIFRHKNPMTLKWEEKHLTSPPSPRIDQKTHVYTLLVQANNSFSIFIDNEMVKSGSLLDDFDPPVNPPKEISDPEDTKPSDWVDEPKIPDPEAVKPEDWDEDAPRMIVDEDAVMPEDWLENEDEMTPDPNAEKPEDWDEEEDGAWVAPQIPNPKCEKASGCGKWTRPMKPNPEYKGKWYPPLIDNPDYKGPWEPKKIPNPDYFEDLNPSKFTKISGIGIELWTMQGDIMFDNFYVGHSLEDARKLADETFKFKNEIEAEAEKEAAAEAEKEAEKEESENKTTDSSSESQLEEILSLLREFSKAFTKDPAAALKKYPYVSGFLALAALVPVLLFLVSGGDSSSKKKKAAEYADRKKKDISTADVESDEDADDEKEEKPKSKK